MQPCSYFDHQYRPRNVLAKHERIVRFMPVFVLLLLVACHRETELREQVTGTWVPDNTFDMTLAADGSLISRWTLPAKSVEYQGTWKIQSGKVVSTITNCIAQGTTNVQPVGTVDN